jgi:hypothetical protein
MGCPTTICVFFKRGIDTAAENIYTLRLLLFRLPLLALTSGLAYLLLARLLVRTYDLGGADCRFVRLPPFGLVVLLNSEHVWRLFTTGQHVLPEEQDEG